MTREYKYIMPCGYKYIPLCNATILCQGIQLEATTHYTESCHWRFEDRGEHHPSQKAGSWVMVFSLKYMVNIVTIASYNRHEEVIYWLFISIRRKKYKQELRGGLRHGVLP
jgi:hypothetical protein